MPADPAARRVLRPLLDAGAAATLAAAVFAVILADRDSGYVPPPVVPEPILSKPEGEPPDPLPQSVPLPLPEEIAAADAADGKPPPEVELPKPLPPDPRKRILLGFQGINDFGILTAEDEKRLTFHRCGDTNNTMVSVDGKPQAIGRIPRYIKQDLPTKGSHKAPADLKDGMQGTVNLGTLLDQDEYTTVWIHPDRFGNRGDIEVTQTTAYVFGETSGRKDTIRVTYTLKNLGMQPHEVGLRVLLDTFIGENDGVPFLVPGQEGVVQQPLSLTGDAVPDHIMALERPDLTDETMTVVKLRFGADEVERPGRLVICHWPHGGEDPRRPLWTYNNMHVPIGDDSAVIVYFEPKPLAPGETRTVGYTYGLGDLSSRESKNAKLAVTATKAVAGGLFRVTAVVNNPVAGQRVKLTLPAGLELDAGESAEKPLSVTEGYAALTQQSWVVRAAREAGGPAEVRVRLDPAGVEEPYRLTVETREPVLTLAASPGPIRANSRLRVAANVFNPRPGQQARLTLPPGLRLDAGEAVIKPLPPGGDRVQVNWVVVVEPSCAGPVTVAGQLLGPDGPPANLRLEVQPAPPRLVVQAYGEVKAGRTFWVQADVVPARPGLSAELQLPAGLRLADGQSAVQPLTERGVSAMARWKVSAEAGKTGQADLAVTVPGVGAKKQPVTIDRGSVTGN